MPTVWIPSLMQKLTGGQGQVEVEGDTLREVIESLDSLYPGFKSRVCESVSGHEQIKSNLAVAVDGEMSPEGMRRKVGANSEVHFLPAMAGGSS